MISKAKFNTVVGNIGAAMGIFVFVAYIPQIIANIPKLSPIYKGQRRSRGNPCLQQYPV